ncbi:hypothetical protein [Wolbachia endosymbiont (group A) of Rhinocyllus conicus]|uniref:hypothetical protein n=1 Tax=Wolbachia endosymbiont (group A) of Rhinocyllus conicus TaxID=2954053 RepID=UPI002226E581|nr:hypothetical protein [Wolbachia endosymbiont (group A) of Rhinocyllus conicus]
MKSLHKFVVNHHCLRCYATKPSQCLGTGMTGEEGYLDDTLLVDSNHNVRTVMRQA